MIKIQNDNIKIAKSIGWDMPLLCNVPCFSSLLVNKERSPGPVSSHQSCMSSCPDDDWWIDMLMRLLLMRQLQQIESNHDKSPGEINTQKVTPFVCSPSAVTGEAFLSSLLWNSNQVTWILLTYTYLYATELWEGKSMNLWWPGTHLSLSKRIRV